MGGGRAASLALFKVRGTNKQRWKEVTSISQETVQDMLFSNIHKALWAKPGQLFPPVSNPKRGRMVLILAFDFQQQCKYMKAYLPRCQPVPLKETRYGHFLLSFTTRMGLNAIFYISFIILVPLRPPSCIPSLLWLVSSLTPEPELLTTTEQLC